MDFNSHPILVVGARTTGLTMACELARHGAAVRIIDRCPGIDPHSRANLLHSRSLEIFDDLGIVDAVLEQGTVLKGGWQYANGRPFRHIRYGELDSPYPFALALGQNRTEAVLERHLGRLGVVVERNTELVDFVAEPDGVQARLCLPDGNEETVATPWLIGCDGAHSRVRHVDRLAFPGEEDTHQYVLADVTVEAPFSADEWHGFLTDRGTLYFFISAPGRRLVVADITEHHDSATETPTLEHIQSLVDQRAVPGFGVSDPRWLAYFRIHYRVARHYRKGRTLLAGDAVHVHSPIGGQGMNTGIQDAYNLAWKLALVVGGRAPESLLDSYQAERRQVAEDVVQTTRAVTGANERFAHLSPSQRENLYFNVMIPEAQRLAQLRHSEELDLDYRSSPICIDRGLVPDGADDGSIVHAGAQAPDADRLIVNDEECTLFDLLHGPRHSALLFTGSDGVSGARDGQTFALARQMADRYGDLIAIFVIRRDAECSLQMPNGVTLVADPTGEAHARYQAGPGSCYIVRPDGYVGCRSVGSDAGALTDYLRQIFGVRTRGIR